MGIVVSREAFRCLRDHLGDEVSIVFTNGCFDLLHIGHMRVISFARGLGDCLVVGINSDDSVRRLKGPGRPLVPQEQRAETMAAHPFVDFVIVFDEDNPVELIKVVRPRFHVKGGDYDKASMPETPVVEALGGSVVMVPLIEGRSSTLIVDNVHKHLMDSR